MPDSITISELVSRYEVLLLDAYGVLVDGGGALPSGTWLLDEIARQGRRYFVVTNDASRLPATCATRFRGVGLAIDESAVITSGALLAPYFAARGLAGARCMVLGTEDAKAYVRAAGGEVVPVSATGACEALVVADDSGYPFLETVEEALSMVCRHLDRGREVALILPNPDLVYPKGDGRYGFTSGAVAALIELGLERRYPGRGLSFTPLGKPHRAMFDEARRRAGGASLVMVGDQLETDIVGAAGAGIDSALLLTGVSHWQPGAGPAAPTYVLSSSAV
ncbi:HAD-IIA family hydrolase [Haliangium sp.]|uniref:HAD-IIA family hydrolase n=1 Tax=Haliangium sp. TaxID=2663208 RepID=UPI003D0A5318